MTRPFWTLLLIGATAISATAQLTPLALNESHYEVAAGQPITLDASGESTDFLLTAESRSVTPQNGASAYFTVGPNRTGNQVMIAASLRTPPGEYAVTLSAKSVSGEQRQTAMDIVVKAQQTVPSNATRAPVVLLNGWETGYTNSCPVSSSSSDVFGNLAQ